jgi:hypothetical protein
MNNFSLLKKTKTTLLTSFSLINRNPSIYAFSFFLVLITLFLNNAQNFLTPIIASNLVNPRDSYTVIAYIFAFINLIISLISVGWLGTKVDFIYQAHKKQKVGWNKVGSLLFKYFKKLLPIALIFFIFSLITLFISTAFYFRDMQSEKFTEYQTYLINHERSEETQSFQEFVNNRPKTFSLTKTFLRPVLSLTSSLIFLFFMQAIVKMVIDQKSIFTSLKNTRKFFFKNISFFILLSLISTLIYATFIFKLKLEVGITPEYILFIMINTYLGLIMNAMVLVNYLENKDSL